MTLAMKVDRSARLASPIVYLCACATVSVFGPGALRATAGVTVLHSGPGGLDLEVTAPLAVEHVTLGGRRYARLRVDDWPTAEVPDRPAVPYLVVPFVVPPTGTARAMVAAQEDTSASVGPVCPAERDRAISPDGAEEVLPAADDDLPAEPVAVEIVGIARDVRMARLIVQPVRVNGGIVTWAKRLQVAIRFTSPATTEATRAKPAAAELASVASYHPAALAANAEEIPSFRIPRQVIPPSARPAAIPMRPRLRLYITEEGIYRITGADLKKWGEDARLDFSTVDPRTLRLELRGQEVPIWVDGEDHPFVDDATAIEFYARGSIERFRSIAPDLYNDPYVESAVYWLSWGERPGARLCEEDVSIRNVPGASTAYSYHHTVHAEKDIELNRLGDVLDPLADRKFWRTVRNSQQETFNVYVEAPVRLAPQMGPTLEVMARGKTHIRHQVEFYLQGRRLGTVGADREIMNQALIDFVKTLDPQTLQLAEGTNTVAVITGDPNDPDLSRNDEVLLNWIELTYDREYRTNTDCILFRPPSNATSNVINFTVQGFTTSGNLTVYKLGVSRLRNFEVEETPPGLRAADSGPYQIRFQDSLVDADTRYIAVTESKKLKPTRVEVAMPWRVSLRDPSCQAEYLMITHSALTDTARRLAEYRRSAAGGGHEVLMVDVRQVYDEFDYGYASSKAIYEFLHYAFDTWRTPPSYVLLVGDGVGAGEYTDHWLASNTPVIPAYEEPVKGWGITDTDYGYSLQAGDDLLPDVAVGRIPAADIASLRAAIDKIIQFEQTPDVSSPWRQSVTLISGRDTDFIVQCEQLAQDVPRQYSLTKVFATIEGFLPSSFLDVFVGSRDAAMAQIERGSLWVTYLGHGGSNVWADEQLLTSADPPKLLNIGRAGIFLSMTCFTGSFESVGSKSLAEKMLFAPGGAIGWFGSSGLGWVRNDFLLAQSILRAGFHPTKAGQTLGSIINAGKTDYLLRYGGAFSVRGSLPHTLAFTFNLVGDPGVVVSPPPTGLTLDTATRTPVTGQQLTITGTLPATVSGTANVFLYDDRDYQLAALPNIPVSGRTFTTDFSVPSSMWGSGLTLKGYVATSGAPQKDWMGASRLAVATTLIDSVQVIGPSRDSLYVAATVIDADGVDSVICIARLNSWENSDSIPMERYGASYHYRTVRPLDLSTISRDSPDREVAVDIRVVDSAGHDTLYTGTRIYPNHRAILQLSIAGLEGTSRPELALTLSNTGDTPTDSLDVSVWLDGPTPILLATRRTAPLSPQFRPTGSADDQVLDLKPTRAGTLASVGAAFVEPQVRLRVPLPDSLVRGAVPEPVLAVSAASIDGRTVSSLSRFSVPTNWGVYTPRLAAPMALSTPSGQIRMEIAPGTLSDSAVVSIEEADLPAQQGQPDITVLGGKACRMTWHAAVHALGSGVALTLRLDRSNPDICQALAANRLRVAYWSDVTTQWEALAAQGQILAADSSSVRVNVSRDGAYALVSVDDAVPPQIEVTVGGQQFHDGAFVDTNARFLVLVEDRNGVSTASDGVRVWIDNVPLPDSIVAQPAGRTTGTSLPVTIRPPELMPREAPYEFRVVARDAAGNEAERTVHFRVAQREQKLLTFHGNFANPFGKEGTVIAFELSTQVEEVSLRIYDVSGRLVLKASNFDLSQLHPEDSPSDHRSADGDLADSRGLPLIATSYHELTWSGKNPRDELVANGVYFGVLRVRGEQKQAEEHIFTMVKAE